MHSSGGVAINLQAVSKRFGGVEAVRAITLEINEGEFFSLLGPSGCGKTTTLRMIAGFEEPDAGRILLRGDDVTGVEPNQRNVNMVFQNYALFPHMSVFDNVAFGLKVKRIPREQQRQRVREILKVVQLEGMEKRRPRQLSGGQQQRVALARALVNRPAALLLDEPLGAIDVKLRKQMQLELKRIQHELGTTFVHVTHDQDEAMAMSDRIAVMNQGIAEQVGAPRDIYEHPATAFVADFVGLLNAFEFRVDQTDGERAIMRIGNDQRIVALITEGTSLQGTFKVGVRPERVRLLPARHVMPADETRLEGTIAQLVYLGTATQFHVDTDLGVTIVSHRLNEATPEEVEPGSRVVLSWGSEYVTPLRSPADGKAVSTTPV